MTAPETAEAVMSGRLQELERQIDAFKRQLNDAERRRRQAEQNLTQLQREERSLVGEVLSLEQDISVAQAELARLTDDLDEAEQRLVSKEQELAQAEEDLEYRDDMLRRRLRTIYEHGSVGYLEVIFSASSFQDFLQRFEGLRLILRQDVSIFDEARKFREQVAEAREALADERRALVTRLAEQEAGKQRVEVMVASREQQLARVQTNAAELEHALDELDATSEDIERQLQTLQKQWADLLAAYGVVPDKFPLLPIDTSGNWRLSSRFGPRFHPILRTQRLHNGTDFAAPTGTPIKAPWPGVVTYADVLGGYGNTVMIMHGSDSRGRQIVTLYAHTSRILVRTGQEVTAGDVIARVGSTGLSTGPHLHFEVRRNGATVNPEPYLPLP